MKQQWKLIYYETEDGECPVQQFIDSRSVNNQAKVFNFFEQLEIKGPKLPRPYSDLLEDGIHELRIKLSGNQARFIYFFCFKDFIILSHAFIKKTKKVPVAEIKRAKKNREDFLKRFNKETLTEVYNENI